MLLIAVLMGADPRDLVEQMGTADPTTMSTQAPPSAGENELAEFVSVVLAETEAFWHDQFRQLGGSYQEPRLVLFTDREGLRRGW